MIIKLIKLAISLNKKGNHEVALKIAQFSMPFLRQNYNYSDESLYHGEMDKYDSVEDFLKKRKKKQKYKPKDLRTPIHPKKKS